MNTLLPFQPDAMTPAQLAAVSYLARSSGHTHTLYSYQLRRWFAWCETNTLDPLIGIQRGVCCTNWCQPDLAHTAAKRPLHTAAKGLSSGRKAASVMPPSGVGPGVSDLRRHDTARASI